MDVLVKYLIQDPLTSQGKGLTKATEGFVVKKEPFFLDGPVTRRVAVLDFDEATGELLPGARFVPPSRGRKRGRYEVADESAVTAADFLQVSVFATVLATMSMYEEKDALGRELRWAFDGPQLLVLPRAGERANAFYERESHSLQFFHFPSIKPETRGRTVFTCLSQDIIAHETAHAILDGIAPDLYHAITPQSLALHEAIADLTALLMALRSRELVTRVLEQTNGSIAGELAFSRLAEEFGFERDPTGRARHLRLLWNEKNLDPDDRTLDELNQPNSVSRSEPHLLSEVLTGALYRVLAHLHDEYRSREAAETGESELSVSGKALFMAREHFKRLVLRALDYLPPGEVSFADYGRAIVAADQASHPTRSEGRDRLVEELLARKVVASRDELAVETGFEHPAVAGLDLPTLVDSDWAAYDFANRHRELLGIPAGVHFRVRPRLKAAKTYWLPGGETTVEECIFKVSWDREEPNPPGLRLPARRQVTVGTTLAIDWEKRCIRALLPSRAAVAPRDEEPGGAADPDRRDRDEMLRRLVAGGQLRIDGAEKGDGLGSGPAVRAESNGALMRVRASGRMLHVAAEEDA